MKQLNSPKEVTHDWIRANFDLKKETKKKKVSESVRLYEIDEGTYEIEEWFSTLRKEVDRAKKEYFGGRIPDDAEVKLQITEDADYDLCGCNTSYRTEFHLLFEWEEDEDEKQTIRRLASREKQKIKKQREREQVSALKEKIKMEQEDKERALLAELLKKYPGAG